MAVSSDDDVERRGFRPFAVDPGRDVRGKTHTGKLTCPTLSCGSEGLAITSDLSPGTSRNCLILSETAMSSSQARGVQAPTRCPRSSDQSSAEALLS